MSLCKGFCYNRSNFNDWSVFIIILTTVRHWLYMQPAKPLPTALLVIYNPGFKFKYKKYYIKEGSNIIGSNPNC